MESEKMGKAGYMGENRRKRILTKNEKGKINFARVFYDRDTCSIDSLLHYNVEEEFFVDQGLRVALDEK